MKLQLEDERVEVQARFQEQGSVRGATKAGTCLGFEIHLSIDSPESFAKITALLETAHRMCFAEDALTSIVSLKTVLVINGEEYVP